MAKIAIFFILVSTLSSCGFFKKKRKICIDRRTNLAYYCKERNKDSQLFRKRD